MNALKLFNLLKQFHGFEDKKKNEIKEFEPVAAASRGKRHVRFIHQKMVVPLMFLIYLFSYGSTFATNNQNLDVCTVSVTATPIDVASAGCGGGSISMSIGSPELYSFEVRSVLDLDLVLISSLNYESGTIQTGPWLFAGDYIVNVETISGCTGQVLVTVNQPPCPSIVPNITTTPTSVNGAYNGEISFSFMAQNSCNGSWYYQIKNLATNAIFANGSLSDPLSVPGILSVDNSVLPGGNYILEIYKGTTENNPTNCNYFNNFTITEPPCDIAFTSTFNNPTASSCNNGSIHLDLTGNTFAGYYVIELYPQAGGLATQYTAAEDAETGILDITGLSGGNYEIIVSNAFLRLLVLLKI
jgi:hypothetical protein